MDWDTGDEIVIAPTGKEGNETEVCLLPPFPLILLNH